MNKTYLANQINSSPTLFGKAGAVVEDIRFKAVTFNDEGKVILAEAGKPALGIAIATTGDPVGKVAVGDQVDIQIKDIGLAMAGGEVKAGAPVTIGTDGKLVTAASGNFILGYAVTAAKADGDIIQIQIAKGYYPTAAN